MIVKSCKAQTIIFCTQAFVTFRALKNRAKKRGSCRKLEGKTCYLVGIIASFTDIF